VVRSDPCAEAGGGQAPPRCADQFVVGGHPELVAVVTCLLEVVPHDLVQLDELAPALLQPGCEAFVEFRARRLRQPVVGRISDQEVAEAEAVLTGELRSVRPNQPPADERSEVRGQLGLRGSKRLDGASMEDLALDRTPLEDTAFGGPELIEASREQCLQRGRNDHLAVRVAGHRKHLLDEERVAASRASDLRSEPVRDALRDERLDVVVAQGLEPERHRPPGPALRELRPRHAEQQDRCA